MIADVYIDSVLLRMDKGNETINQIISCLSGKDYTLNEVKYLLEQVHQEILARTKV